MLEIPESFKRENVEWYQFVTSMIALPKPMVSWLPISSSVYQSASQRPVSGELICLEFERSPEIQNRDISGPTKRTNVLTNAKDEISVEITVHNFVPEDKNVCEISSVTKRNTVTEFSKFDEGDEINDVWIWVYTMKMRCFIIKI